MNNLNVIEKEQESKQVVEYGISNAALNELRAKNSFIVVVDSKSLKQAKMNKLELVSLRTSVEKKRKELKADALEWGRKVDTEAKRITTALEEIEALVKAPIDEYEAAIEAEKAAKAAIEKARVDGIKQRIDEWFGATALLDITTMGVNELDGVINDASRTEIDCSFAEFKEKAEAARTRFIDMAEIYKARAIESAEQKEKERQEREEFEKQRAEQAAKQALIDAEYAKQMSEAEDRRLRFEAENARIRAEQAEAQRKIDEHNAAIAFERAAIEAEKKAIEEQKAREEYERYVAAKLEKEARERIEYERIQAEEKAKAEAAELARREALRPDKEKLIDLIHEFTVRSLTLESKEAKKLYLWFQDEFENLIQAFEDQVELL